MVKLNTIILVFAGAMVAIIFSLITATIVLSLLPILNGSITNPNATTIVEDAIPITVVIIPLMTMLASGIVSIVVIRNNK